MALFLVQNQRHGSDWFDNDSEAWEPCAVWVKTHKLYSPQLQGKRYITQKNTRLQLFKKKEKKKWVGWSASRNWLCKTISNNGEMSFVQYLRTHHHCLASYNKQHASDHVRSSKVDWNWNQKSNAPGSIHSFILEFRSPFQLPRWGRGLSFCKRTNPPTLQNGFLVTTKWQCSSNALQNGCAQPSPGLSKFWEDLVKIFFDKH